ncbi:MAG: Flp pilus assembly complex ATPase component TadA [Candidatus Omnitrophica bacterium]|nr:Flp pilus assembly complex ATPase component TadA [Candidatus Omnitrophota bacterium]
MAKTIVIFSSKGGVGRTLFATNLGVSLAQEEEKKVCLIDLHIQGTGDMARMLHNLQPQKSLVDLASFLQNNPGSPFQKNEFFSTQSDLKIDFIPAVLQAQQSIVLKADAIRQVLAAIDKQYDFIIIDAGGNFNNYVLEVLNQASLILLVMTPDVNSVFQVQWTLGVLQSLFFPLPMVKVVLNRAEAASSLSWQEVKVSLPVEIVTRIPSDGRAAGDSVNRLIPAVLDNPKSKLALAIKNFSQQLVTDANLYIERQPLEHLALKGAVSEDAGEFWKERGLAQEPPKAATEQKEEFDRVTFLKQRIHQRLISELNLKRLDAQTFTDTKKTQDLREKAQGMVSNFLAEESGNFIPSQEIRNQLVKEILDEALGYGCLEDLLEDDSITDIMVNNKNQVYIERKGKILLTDKRFTSNDQVKIVIERIIAPIGRRIDEAVPMVDARLPDGSRVNAIIPPLALSGPAVTIRKFRHEVFTAEEIITFNSLSREMADFIKASVLCRKNIIVSGGTGSGKTTFLNILSAFIHEGERILTIEDAAELRLHQRHWIRLESKPPTIEGKGAVTIRDLFRNTLRMRPDRIIIGECRGLETLDMLQAMNTGHDGSMTTIHANSTQDVLARLDSMILMSGVDLPIRAIREMISSAIDLIVHSARLPDGTRKIVQISELTGMKDDLHIELQDIFTFKQTGLDAEGNVLGCFQPKGNIPTFMDEIKIHGLKLPESIFKPVSETPKIRPPASRSQPPSADVDT